MSRSGEIPFGEQKNEAVVARTSRGGRLEMLENGVYQRCVGVPREFLAVEP